MQEENVMTATNKLMFFVFEEYIFNYDASQTTVPGFDTFIYAFTVFLSIINETILLRAIYH